MRNPVRDGAEVAALRRLILEYAQGFAEDVVLLVEASPVQSFSLTQDPALSRGDRAGAAGIHWTAPAPQATSAPRDFGPAPSPCGSHCDQLVAP